MALIFLGVPIIFTISSFEFHKSHCRDFIVNDEWPPVHQNSIQWIIRFGGNAGVLLQAATKAKTVPEFKDAIQLIWSALPENVIDNAVKDYRKQLKACVSANVGHFEHIV